MPRPINIVLIYKDAKNSEGQTLINLANQDEGTTLAEMIAAATAHQIDADALSNGQILRCGVLIDVEIDGSLKTSPVADCDLEEGAEFIFSADNGFTTQIRIPAFVESKFVTASPEVDLVDSDVDAFITNMIDGYDGGSGLLDVQTSRGEDIVSLSSAKKSFQKSRV